MPEVVSWEADLPLPEGKDHMPYGASQYRLDLSTHHHCRLATFRSSASSH